MKGTDNFGKGNYASTCESLMFDKVRRCKNRPIDFPKQSVSVNDDPTALNGSCLDVEHDSSVVKKPADIMQHIQTKGEIVLDVT